MPGTEDGEGERHARRAQIINFFELTRQQHNTAK